jgi:hypothetical protein
VRVRLTEKGRNIREIVGQLFASHAEGMESRGLLTVDGVDQINGTLRRLERYWTDQIRYIY